MPLKISSDATLAAYADNSYFLWHATAATVSSQSMRRMLTRFSFELATALAWETFLLETICLPARVCYTLTAWRSFVASGEKTKGSYLERVRWGKGGKRGEKLKRALLNAASRQFQQLPLILEIACWTCICL